MMLPVWWLRSVWIKNGDFDPYASQLPLKDAGPAPAGF